MTDKPLLVAIIAGILQGVFEWLPISSEGNIALFMKLVVNADPKSAAQFGLLLHAGTAVSAALYYRGELAEVLQSLPEWRPDSAFERDTAELSYLVVATLVSGVVGISIYLTIFEAFDKLAGGAFVALIGVLLVGTGVLLKSADRLDLGNRDAPDLTDAVLVGACQGLAMLPGVSRSGTTASALLFRGHDGPAAFRLSFLLSIPAAAGAGVLTLLDDGVPAIAPDAAVIAIVVSAIVGYLTIDALMRIVSRVAFWGICVGLGTLAILGGVSIYVTV